ncbi:pentatricopeptide repeat-containing protein At2g46050, mitochondrial isoform X1 [Juglans microcarpa x Juglans regia]|uniref:pentatricopeptide repeat-containing protein At2g46050, mitochondrial isoform X1 n=1 Tax=Juglans microcarpa x Juglans regia TaxID=2249226 RepID=UPI001B7F7450|nr:pentatricopeptide repeat-containing protein At2g46050, mitochondrial isoform X1 [Juglans microcarpa x Juglans regia]
MLSRCRSSSKPTVLFKRQLTFPPTTFSVLRSQNAQNQEDPFYINHSPLSLGRLRAKMLLSASTHLTDPHSAPFFCSDALRVSAKMGFLPEGKQLHAHMIKFGLCNVLALHNHLLNVYFRCQEFDDAKTLFGEMRARNVVSWNTVICGFVDWRSNNWWSLYLGFSYFRRMLLERVGPDDITFNSLFRACIELHDVVIGRQLHCFIVKVALDFHSFVGSALVKLYATFGLVEDARRAFNGFLFRDLVLWNVMLSGYVSNCLVKDAFGVFNLMQLEGVKGDEFTFSSLMNSCSALGTCDLGKQIHSLIVKKSFDLDVQVASVLIDMYAKNKNIDDARKAFDGIAIKNVVSWNTMIVGYGQQGDGKEAMKLLRGMLRTYLYLDELALSSILSSCGNVSATCEIMQVHACTVKFGFQVFISISNALINAYSKCGSILGAYQCFSSVLKPDLVTWTSILCAYAFHGLAKEATNLFEKMLSHGMKPDPIAFLGVLSACSHGGLVEKGLHYFNLMINDYQIVPDSNHFTCLIDLLARSGLLDEAFSVLASMPIEPGSDTLGAFIGACKVHKNLELAKWAAEKLFALEPNKLVNYALMSNVYASQSRWFDVAGARKMIRDRCDSKVPGCSWVEIAGNVHSFVSSDKSHPKSLEVYVMLGTLHSLMKDDNHMLNVKLYS